VLVISEKTYEAWKDTPGTVIYEAALEGRVDLTDWDDFVKELREAGKL